jgi:hypothetical protein
MPNTTTTTAETDTARLLRDSVAGVAEELEAIETTGEFPPGPWTEDGDTPTVYDWLDSFVDVETATNQNGAFFAAELVATTGGPNIWIELNKSHTATVHGAWGSDRHTVTVYLPVLREQVADLVEEQHENR